MVRIGDAEGPGVIEGDDAFVRRDERLGYLVFVKPSAGPVQAFDHSGQFLRLIGRSGEGPGEIGGIVDVNVVGSRIVVLDWRKRAWLLFDRSGQTVSEAQHSMAGMGEFVPVDGDHIVMATIDRRPDLVANPLHVVNVVTGDPLRHFGALDSNWAVTDPFAGSVIVSGVSTTGTVWVGKAASPTIKEWSLEGDLLRSIDGELPWFPLVTAQPDIGKEQPPTLLRAVAMSPSGQLWVLTSTADPDWRKAELTTLGEEVVIERSQRDGYRDSRLDIFDIEGRIHIGFHTWDSAGVRLLNQDGEPAVSVMEYTDEMVPQVGIYRGAR